MKMLLKRLLSRFATPLPVGMSEFNTWADSVIELAGRYADIDSLKFALATMIIHADAKHGYLPKAYFVERLRKVAANQVASQVFTDIKEKQNQAQASAKLAAETKTLDEVTPAPAGNSSNAQTA